MSTKVGQWITEKKLCCPKNRIFLYTMQSGEWIWWKQHESMGAKYIAATILDSGASIKVWEKIWVLKVVFKIVWIRHHIKISFRTKYDITGLLYWWFLPQSMSTFNKKLYFAILLVLYRIGFRNVKESLLCLGSPYNSMIAIQLGIYGMNLKHPSDI